MSLGKWINIGVATGALFVGAMFLGQGFYTVDAGETSIIQNTLDGSMDVVRGPKFGVKLPFFTGVYRYRDVSTITFGEGTDDNTRHIPMQRVRFADTYASDITLSFRFRLPIDDSKMLALHRDYRSYDNAVDSLFIKNAVNVSVVTATQFTGEEFFQGGFNSYKEALESQMKSGLYQTERKQVEVEQLELQSVSAENSSSRQLEIAKQLVWKTVPILDSTGVPKRQSNPFQNYGIEVTQVTLGSSTPEELLSSLLTDKKTLVGKRIRTIQEQETAKAEADTAQLLKEIERTKAVQDANRNKELAIIAELQQVEVARQQATKETVVQTKLKDLAVIDKQKELEIARSEEAIQKANAQAAVYQAQAIKEVGLAEAQVSNAKYAALGANKEIYLAEVQKDISNSLYSNLANFKVQMPTIVSGGSSGSGMNTNLDILSSFAALGMVNGMSDNALAKSVATNVAGQ